MAREYRIPVVMGIGLGLEHITEGDGLWVDGNAGFVATFNPRSAWQIDDLGRMQPQDET
jgi:phosphoenolpyruvate-protein kinase (PTS system EI component)